MRIHNRELAVDYVRKRDSSGEIKSTNVEDADEINLDDEEEENWIKNLQIHFFSQCFLIFSQFFLSAEVFL
jgi:hypothetical protein